MSDIIGIPKGLKKVETRITTAKIVDHAGWTLSKGQRFFVLEMTQMKRPAGFSIPIAIDNGFEDDDCYPVTGISEDDFYFATKKEKSMNKN